MIGLWVHLFLFFLTNFVSLSVYSYKSEALFTN
jgi:hypothetical protein